MGKIVLMGLTLMAMAVVMFKAITVAAAGVSPLDMLAKDNNTSAIVQSVVVKTQEAALAASLKSQASGTPLNETDEDDALDLKALRQQMNKQRDIQQQIKLHNLELEQTKVQLEQEKALAEMNQLRKANLGIVKDPNGDGMLSLPDTKVIFLSASEKGKEAILSINGGNYTVKEGDRPLNNVLVKLIDNKGVTILVNGEKEIVLTPNLME